MKKIIFFSILVFGCSVCYAQTFSWTDTTARGIGVSIATDESGNVFSVNNPHITNLLYITAEPPSFLNKYNSNGVVEWTRSMPYSTAVTTDNADNSYVTGYYYFRKYNSVGNVIYTDSATGSSVVGQAICSDGGKYLYITGYWGGGGTAIFGSQSLVGTGYGPQLFILKCDTAGNMIWVKTSNGSENTYPNNAQCKGLGINVSPTGLIYVTGCFSDSIILGTDSLNTSMTNYVGFVACYDANGNTLWARSVNRYVSQGNAVSSDGVGNVYITGSAGRFADFFIAKYKSNGDSVWWRECRGDTSNQFSFGYGISTNLSGTSFITGTYQDAPFGSLYITGGVNIDNIFIVEYDSLGNALWGYCPNDTLGDSFTNEGYAVCTDKGECNFYFTGYAEDPIRFNNSYTYTDGNNIMYVTKLKDGCLLSGLAPIVNSNQTINVFPNPFNNSTTVAVNTEGKHYLEVDDITGRKLQTIEFTGKQYELSAQGLAKGMYFVRVFDDQNALIGTSKIVVQ